MWWGTGSNPALADPGSNCHAILRLGMSGLLQVRKGFWKQPPLIWDADPEQVRVLNPYYMEVTAAKLLSLPMKQPRKVKQVRGGDGQSPCTP